MSSHAIDQAIARAKSILEGADASPAEAIDLIQPLHQDRQFGLARRMLEKLWRREKFVLALDADPPLKRRFAQKRSLSTYKDPDLATDLKHTRALEILQSVDPLDRSTDPETLGQAGAIYKNMWTDTGRERHLETSLAFYLRGYQQGVEKDFGYTGINAAFVLDLLADLESPDQQPVDASRQAADQRRVRAADIRRDIQRALGHWPQTPGNEWRGRTWWYLVTLGEACFGLEDYAGAEQWLDAAARLPDIPDWVWETTARQLATLWRIQKQARLLRGQPADSRGEEVLTRFLGNARPAFDSVVRG
jgi:hypothetical protein